MDSNKKRNSLDGLKQGERIVIKDCEFEVIGISPLSYGSYQLILKPYKEKQEENKK